jgi:hypothetical protein
MALYGSTIIGAGLKAGMPLEAAGVGSKLRVKFLLNQLKFKTRKWKALKKSYHTH